MKHAIATVSLAGKLPQKLQAIAANGYQGFELFEPDLTVANISPRELKSMADDLGLEVVALQPLRDFEAMPRAQQKKNLFRAERKFELMAELGTSRLLICSNVSPLCQDDNKLAAEDLNVLGDLAAQYGVNVGYEALAWGIHVDQYLKSWDIVSLANHPNVGIILDSFHILVKGADVAPIRHIPADKIVLVQTADAPMIDMGELYLSRHYRCFPGQGSMPVEGFFRAIAATGYQGYLSHEIFSDEFRASPVFNTALEGRRSLMWLDEIIHNARTPVAQSSSTKFIKDAVERVEFLEIAVSNEEQPHLETFLKGLGFRETYRHRVKDVSLFQLGEVYLVLNRQDVSHALSYMHDHGVGVCAIGMSAKEPERLVNWAQQLKYLSIDEHHSEDEMDIPGVIGPGDVLFYFVDSHDPRGRFYDVDFIPTGAESLENGVLTVDHVGQAVKADAYLSSCLFYRSVLGLSIDDSVDLNDPYGVVQSRVATNTSRQIQIPINTSRSWGTSPSRFVTATSGGGVQQIALASHDIFVTAASLDPSLVLQIPDNYYRDLRSKSLLSDAVIDRMALLNILYDENDDGQFFHVYSVPHNGLFFEFAQRVDEYKRFGEANAAVRLAAHNRLMK